VYGPADATALIVSCFSKIQIGFTFLVPVDPGSPGQRAVKWVCVYSYSHIHLPFLPVQRHDSAVTAMAQCLSQASIVQIGEQMELALEQRPAFTEPREHYKEIRTGLLNAEDIIKSI